MVKNLSAMRKTWVRSLGWEDHVQKEMATHFTTLAYKIPWTKEPGRLQSKGLHRVRQDFTFTFSLFCDDIIKQLGNTGGADLMSLIQNQWFSKYPWNTEMETMSLELRRKKGVVTTMLLDSDTVVTEVLGMK